MVRCQGIRKKRTPGDIGLGWPALALFCVSQGGEDAMKIRSYDMTEVSTNRRTFSKRRLVVLLMVVLAPAAVASTVFAAPDVNPVQQILTIVQGIQATLTGTGGSIAALQSDVVAIKAKTDNLPENTSGTLVCFKQLSTTSRPPQAVWDPSTSSTR